MSNQVKRTNKLVASAICLALAMILPIITGNLTQIGNMLCPMHFPVIICGFICGWQYGLVVGFVAPLLRFLIFGMPPIMPIGLAMAFELAAYGAIAGFMYSRLGSGKKINIYISLLTAMVIGRVIWGIVKVILSGVNGTEFTFALFIAGAFTTAIPGIILQIILIPIIVMALEKANLVHNGRKIKE